MSNLKWKKCLFAIGIIFYLYCSVRGAYVHFRYDPFCKAFPARRTSLDKDSHIYSVKKPPFLSFTGNLVISEYAVFSRDMPEKTTADLTIWPRGINDYDIGVTIIEWTTDFDNHSSRGNATDMMLDEKMKLLDDTPENRRLYEQNLDKIENLYRLAYEMWGILELK